jgi:hypothetical protein
MKLTQSVERLCVRKWGVGICGALALVAGACGTSDEDVGSMGTQELAITEYNCIGAPTGTVGGETLITKYPEPRIWLESQGWWGEGSPPPQLGNAEHIHVGMCFPVGQTMVGQTTLQVKVHAHNMNGATLLNTNLHDPGEGALPEINWNLAINSNDFVKTKTVTFNTLYMEDGRREFRNLTKVRTTHSNPDGSKSELHASSGWCWNIQNNDEADTDSGGCGNNFNSIEGRGWYQCFEYKVAEVQGWGTQTGTTPYPWGGINRNGGSYTINVDLRDGAGALNNNLSTGWRVHIDPDFHNNNNLGVWWTGQIFPNGGPNHGYVTIPSNVMAGLSTTQAHKLVFISQARGTCNASGVPSQTGEVSAVQVVSFKVF